MTTTEERHLISTNRLDGEGPHSGRFVFAHLVGGDQVCFDVFEPRAVPTGIRNEHIEPLNLQSIGALQGPADDLVWNGDSGAVLSEVRKSWYGEVAAKAIEFQAR